jgi:hypothetical protein
MARKSPVDGTEVWPANKSSPKGSQFFNGEPCMRNRLQVSFWGLHLSAEGIVAIAAALIIVIAVLVASRL